MSIRAIDAKEWRAGAVTSQAARAERAQTWPTTLGMRLLVDGEEVDALGGWRGRVGLLLTAAVVAFPMGSALLPVLSHLWPGTVSLGGEAVVGTALWLGALGWVAHGMAAETAATRAHAR